MPKKNLLTRIALMSLFALLGGLFGYSLAAFSLDGVFQHFPELPDWGKVTLLVSAFLIAYLLVVVLHELGHMLAGIAQGFRFWLISVGPVGFRRDANDKIKGFVQWGRSGIGGMSITLPQQNDPQVAKKFMFMILAGPLANLITGTIFLILAIFLFQSDGSELFPQATALISLITGVLSWFVGIINLIPMQTGSPIMTDGTRIRRLMSGGNIAATEVAMVQITAYLMMGTSYKDIPSQAFDQLPQGSDIHPTVAMLRYGLALDTEDYPAMRLYLAILKEAWKGYPVTLRGQLAMEIAFAVAVLEKNPEEAASFWVQVPASIQKIYPWTAIRTSAALAHSQGKSEEFQQLLAQAEDMQQVPAWELPQSQIRWMKAIPMIYERAVYS